MRCLQLFAWVLFVAGCNSGGEPPTTLRCDVREETCRQSIMDHVIALRGDEAVELPVTRVVTEAELDERLRSEDPPDAEQRADIDLVYRGYALFGLLPADYRPEEVRMDQVREIAGVYSPDDNEIFLVDRGAPMDSVSAIVTFAHELVHALQQRRHDLIALQERAAPGGDAWLALRALTEGEATLYGTLISAELAGLQTAEIDWGQLLPEFQAAQLSTAVDDAAPLAMASLRIPYAFGAGYVTRRWLEQGQKGIDKLYEEPPSSTHEVLFDAQDTDLVAENEALSARAVPELEGKHVGTTRLGAWQRALFFSREAQVRKPLWYARETLADAFSIWHDEARDLVSASWRVRFAPDANARNWLGVDDWYVGSVDVEEPREVFLIASEGELPTDLQNIAWREAMTSIDDEARAPSMLHRFQRQ